MISLLQNENLIIGSAQAIKELEEKTSARIILFSDSHGNSKILKNIILRFGAECDAIAFCGDGLSDIAELLYTAKSSKEFNDCFPPVLAFVQGNCDPLYFPMNFEISETKSGEKYWPLNAPAHQILRACHKNILITHGHHEGINFDLLGLSLKAQENDCSCAVFGHSHVPHDTLRNDIKIINPGSVSRPRNNMPPSFGILTITPTVMDVAFIKIDRPVSDNPEFKVFTPIF